MATSPFASPLWVPRFRAWNQAGSSPLASGKVYTYEAGTTTPLASYPTYDDALAGTNANANPVVLDAYGEAPIFLTNALYKIVVKDSADVTQWTMDDVGPALGYPQPYPSEWVQEANALTYSSGTQFLVDGIDVTSIYHAGRRVKTTNTGGTVYGTVVTSSFSTDTTVTITADSGSLDSGLSAVYYGENSYANPSYLSPRSAFTAIKNGDMTGFGSATKIATWTSQVDALSEWDAANNRWVAKYGGNYLATLTVELADTGTNVDVTADLRVGGTAVAQARTRSHGTATNVTSVAVTHICTLSAAGYIEAYVTGSANTTVQGTKGTRLAVVRVP